MQTMLTNVLYALLLVLTVFAAQFSRSRFSLLALLWLLFMLSREYALPWSAWLKLHPQWLMLSGVMLFPLFALIKDRGLLSIHVIYRVCLIVFCGLLAYAWLWGSAYLSELVNEKLDLVVNPSTSLENSAAQLARQLVPYLSLALPMVIAAALLIWQSLRKVSLIQSALLVSFILWCLEYYQLISLPWHILLLVLVCQYLLMVMIDSYFLAYRDDLTGLASRRALNQYVLSLGSKYTVAMLDIDHFKKFNDSYGHDIGDQVLKLVAAKLARVKGGGKVFRYGGEEFTIVFARKTGEQAVPELELLRNTIADYKIVVRKAERKSKQDRAGTKAVKEKTVSVTISIGVAMRQGKQTFDQALKSADESLYRAKKSGRNNTNYVK